MSTEQSLADSAAAVAAAPETPAPQADSPGESHDGNVATSDGADSDLIALLPPDDGFEEVEWEGEKHKIPAKLKSALMAHADYTRKTQEVAEQRRAIEAQAAEVQRNYEFQRQNIQEVAQVVSIDNQLAEYEKLDWPTLIAHNPQQAMLLEQQRRELQGKRAQLAQTISHKEREGLEKQRQAVARRIEDTQRELSRDITGWSPAVANELTDYGRKAGFPAEVLSPAAPAVFVKTLHKAMQWDRLLAQRNTKRAPATPDKPVPRVSGGSSPATKDMEQLNADDWRKERERQLANKRKKR